MSTFGESLVPYLDAHTYTARSIHDPPNRVRSIVGTRGVVLIAHRAPKTSYSTLSGRTRFVRTRRSRPRNTTRSRPPTSLWSSSTSNQHMYTNETATRSECTTISRIYTMPHTAHPLPTSAYSAIRRGLLFWYVLIYILGSPGEK